MQASDSRACGFGNTRAAGLSCAGFDTDSNSSGSAGAACAGAIDGMDKPAESGRSSKSSSFDAGIGGMPLMAWCHRPSKPSAEASATPTLRCNGRLPLASAGRDGSSVSGGDIANENAISAPAAAPTPAGASIALMAESESSREPQVVGQQSHTKRCCTCEKFSRRL